MNALANTMTYDLQLETFLDIIDETSITADLWDSLYGLLQNMDCDAMSYYHIPPPGALDFDEDIFISRGYNSEITTKNSDHHALIKTPFKDRTQILKKPTFWSNFLQDYNISNEQKATLKNLYCNGHINGIVIPTHGPNSRDGCFVIRFKDEIRRFKKAETRKLQWACQYTHQRFCILRNRERNKPVPLTIREQEILTWVARGKTNSVIADIIGISQHTVNGYLRRIYLKTGTSDRTTATVRSLGESLINY